MKRIKNFIRDSDSMFFTMMGIYVLSGFIVVFTKAFPPEYCTATWVVCMSLYLLWHSYIRKP